MANLGGTAIVFVIVTGFLVKELPVSINRIII